MTLDDAAKLRSREWGTSRQSERDELEIAMRPYATHEDEELENAERLAALNRPAFHVRAAHQEEGAAGAADQEVGPRARLLLARGARVMLKQNLWPSRGLTTEQWEQSWTSSRDARTASPRWRL